MGGSRWDLNRRLRNVAIVSVFVKTAYRGIQMCYGKQLRRPRTKVRNLARLGLGLDLAIKHAVSRKSYWRLSQTPAMRYAMANKCLEQLGLLSLEQLWCDLAPLRGTA